MRRIGVEPVCDRDRFRQVVYRRDEALAALARRAAEKAAAVADVVEVPDGIDAQTFARAVGIDLTMIPQLVAAGTIKPLVAGHRYVFAHDAPDEFRRRYATATEFSKAVGKNGAGVTPLLKRLGVQPTHERPQFYSALYPRVEAEAAIARFLADEAEKARVDAEAAADDEPRMQSREACRFLGCTDLLLTQLRKAGLIEAEPDGKAFIYRQSELDRFKPRYVLGAELGEMVGRPGAGGAKAMTKVVLDLGVKPVCSRPELYSFLFERAEAMRALKGWNGVTNKAYGPGKFDSRNKAIAGE